MRTVRFTCATALLCLTTIMAPAQRGRRSSIGQISLPSKRVPIKTLPAPAPGAHGHPQETRSGTTPCPATNYTYSVNCGGKTTTNNSPTTGTTATPPAETAPKPANPTTTKTPSPAAPTTTRQPPPTTDQPSPRGDIPSTSKVPPVVTRGGGGSAWPVGVGVGVGVFAGTAIWSLSEQEAHQAADELSRSGPQFPESLRMSDFRVTGFAKGGWPVVVDYEAAPGTYILLTVVTQNASPAEAVLAAPQNGRRLQLLSLPLEFGTTLKTAAFSLSATASATDPTPRYLRIYGFGCGPRAVGSVAIDLLRFGPQEVSAAQPETQFGFHTHTTFDKMKAEFMQVAMVDHSIEGHLFDNKKIDRRVAEGESINDRWNAKKAQTGQIQFRVRGWMTVRSDADGGDWVSAFSPDLVFKQ